VFPGVKPVWYSPIRPEGDGAISHIETLTDHHDKDGMMNRWIALLLFLVPAVLTPVGILLAESRSYTMPDGSKVVAEVPAGVTFNQEDAVRTWKAVRKMETEQRRTGNGSRPTGSPKEEAASGFTAEGHRLRDAGLDAKTGLPGVPSGQETSSGVLSGIENREDRI
jgi:hypothetical protein